MIENIFRNDAKFRDELRETLRIMVRAQLDSLRKELVPPIEMKDIVYSQFPGGEAELWRGDDEPDPSTGPRHVD